MTLNPLFKQLNYLPEQQMLENLGIEMIQQYGLEVAYLKRTHVRMDPLFIEDPLSKFEEVRYIEMYMKDYLGYGQLSDMMSKFGPMMSDTLTLSVSRKRFAEEFPDLGRPTEGDLIWIAMTNTLFEIRYVEHEDQFYQHGNLFYYDIKLERFKYSHETLNTGVDEVDRIEDQYSMAVTSRNKFTSENGMDILLESGRGVYTEQVFPTDDGDLRLENDQALDSENDEQIGVNAYDPFNPNVQNKYFQTEGEEIIDFSEANPFGKM